MVNEESLRIIHYIKEPAFALGALAMRERIRREHSFLLQQASVLGKL